MPETEEGFQLNRRCWSSGYEDGNFWPIRHIVDLQSENGTLRNSTRSLMLGHRRFNTPETEERPQTVRICWNSRY